MSISRSRPRAIWCRTLALSSVVALAALLTVSDHAVAGTWTPNGASVRAVSTSFAIRGRGRDGVTRTTLCARVIVTGSLGMDQTTWGMTPDIHRCTRTVSYITPWTAVDEGVSTAGLEFPHNGLSVEISPSCTIIITESMKFSVPVNYENGNPARPLSMPSYWTNLDQLVTFSGQNPAGCFRTVPPETNQVDFFGSFNVETPGNIIRVN